MQIGRLEPGDLPAALRLSTGAGWNQVDADWLRLMALWPGGCLAGRVDGALVATAVLAVYPPGVGWVGMVLVDEAHRGRGIGGRMMDAVLDAADRAGVSRVGLDATDLGRPVYLKRGFVDAVGVERRVLAGDRRPIAVEREAVGAGGTNPLRDDDWASLVALDRARFGADRSALLARLRDEPGTVARVARDGGRVVGYGFRRPGRTAEQIGPVVAESADVARRLIWGLAARGEGAPDILLDAFRGGELDAWLDGVGVVARRRLTRMWRGTGAAELPAPAGTYAAAGLELG